MNIGPLLLPRFLFIYRVIKFGHWIESFLIWINSFWMVCDLFRDSLFHGCSIVWRTTTTTCSSISIACSGVVWGECNAWSEWNLERKSTKNRKGKKEEEEEVTKMPCSAVTLSLATITGIIATGLLAIAFSTDNWLYTEVKRAQIQVCKSNLFFLQVFFLWYRCEIFRKNLRCHVVLFHIFHVFIISFILYLPNSIICGIYYRSYIVFTYIFFPDFLIEMFFSVVRSHYDVSGMTFINPYVGYDSWTMNVWRARRYSSRYFHRGNTIISDIPINTYGEFSWISRWNVILKIQICCIEKDQIRNAIIPNNINR